ncbi:MAG: TolC family protein [Planctomycetes bacterium]|nr:TolC family protein [Planctomycetota bacterium]
MAGPQCRIFRSLLVGKSLSLGDGALDVFRFDFAVDQGQVGSAGSARLTSDGGNALPVAVGGGTVAWLHLGDGARHQLMAMDADGRAPHALLPGQAYEVRSLRADSSGVVFAADPVGSFQLFHCGLDGAAPIAWKEDAQGAVAAGPQTGIAFATVDGHLRPRLIEIPPHLELKDVAALVEARNPAVLRRRALLAAALIEARQLRLANLPTLNLGAFYTPAVGIFTNPTTFSGDYLAQNVLRGVLGVTQPLFEWDRNHALSEAGVVRASIARDALAEEVNRQQADAALAFVAWQAYRQRLDHDRELAALAERAAGVLDQQRKAGRSGLEQDLVLEQERVKRRGDVASDERWQRILLERLLGLCGLAAGTPTEPGAPASWELPVDEYPDLLRVALLNHPAMSAAHAALREAFFSSQAGSRYRPTVAVSAGYAYSARNGSDPVDDFTSLGLTGNLPLGWFKDRDLDRAYQERLQEALRAGEEAAALVIRHDLAEAWAAYHQARGELEAGRAGLRAARETLRVAHLRAERAQGGGDAPLTATGLIEIERTALLAERAQADTWQLVAERYIRISQAQGLAAMLAQGMSEPAAPAAAAPGAGVTPPGGDAVVLAAGTTAPASTWAWHRDVILADHGAAALATATSARIDRIYLYIGAAGTVLEGESASAIEAFIASAGNSGVAVWALLGEPEWLQGADGLAPACRRLAAFQEHAAHRFQGLKLDLEPQADPGWAAGGERRLALTNRYLELLRAARTEQPAALWVDCPAQFFRVEQRELLTAIAATTDGATALCYSADPERVVALAREALAAWPKELEFGIELGSGSPADETLRGLAPTRLDTLRQSLAALAGGAAPTHRTALHDLTAVMPAPPSPAQPASPSQPASPPHLPGNQP